VNDLTLALAAGLVAAVNPCGFALLPAYLAVLLAGPDGAPRAAGRLARRPAAIARALRLTAAMTAGFVAVFGGYGLVAGAVATAVQPVLPWVSVAGGVLLAGAGAWLAAGRHLPLRVSLLRGRVPGGSVLSLTIYGAWYATASLSCTIAPFLAVTAAAVRSGGLLRGRGHLRRVRAGDGARGGRAVDVGHADPVSAGRAQQSGTSVCLEGGRDPAPVVRAAAGLHQRRRADLLRGVHAAGRGPWVRRVRGARRPELAAAPRRPGRLRAVRARRRPRTPPVTSLPVSPAARR
jgi:cytochrome c biogenesis protein CcdA